MTNSDEAADIAPSIYHRDTAIPAADSFYSAACVAINVHITSPLFEQQIEAFYLLRRLGDKTFLAHLDFFRILFHNNNTALVYSISFAGHIINPALTTQQ